jgi:hypothetical protein
LVASTAAGQEGVECAVADRADRDPVSSRCQCPLDAGQPTARARATAVDEAITRGVFGIENRIRVVLVQAEHASERGIREAVQRQARRFRQGHAEPIHVGSPGGAIADGPHCLGMTGGAKDAQVVGQVQGVVGFHLAKRQSAGDRKQCACFELLDVQAR